MIDVEGALREIIQRQRRPALSFIESWQGADAVPAAADWTASDPATGTAWGSGTSGAYRRCVCAPNADEVARLLSVKRWMSGFGIYGDNTAIRQLFVEFEAKLADVANLDNSASFLGLVGVASDTRASNNIIGFGLASDALQTVTDAAGTETANTTFGETLTNWNRFGIYISRASARFLLNGTVIATHITNVPAIPSFVNFYLDTEAGGAATLELGIVRVWAEESVRYQTLP